MWRCFTLFFLPDLEFRQILFVAGGARRSRLYKEAKMVEIMYLFNSPSLEITIRFFSLLATG